MPGASWGVWKLVLWPGIEPGPPALAAQSLSHWTTRQVPLPSRVRGSSVIIMGFKQLKGFKAMNFFRTYFKPERLHCLRQRKLTSKFLEIIGKGNSDKDLKQMKIVFLGGPSFSVRISGCRCAVGGFRHAPLSLGLRHFCGIHPWLAFPQSSKLIGMYFNRY